MTATDPNPGHNPTPEAGSGAAPQAGPESDLETALRRELALRARALGTRPPAARDHVTGPGGADSPRPDAVPFATIARAVRRDRRRRHSGAAATLDRKSVV